jgi:DNA polymerase I-like protein with 3'-5' exonuclease and polymerase domains
MFVHNPDVIATALEDELVLLNPRNQAMFSLNATGKLVWEHVEHPLEDIAAKLEERFTVDRDAARRDASALLARLEGAGLIRAQQD